MVRGKDIDGGSSEFEEELFELQEEAPRFPEDVFEFPDEMLETQGVEISIKIDGELTEWNVQSQRVIEILRNTSRQRETKYLENCFEIGDAVLRHASVQTSEETLEKYFGSVRNELTQKLQGLEALRVKVDKALLENFPSLIKTQIEGVLKD